jgi:DNA mismatch repair protein MutH
MERDKAIKELQKLEGKDLVDLAQQLGIPIWRGSKKNKGWAGHVIERYLGLPLNSAQSPNFGSWELKIVPLKKLQNGTITVKETMAITMIDPHHVMCNPFSSSHLLTKLQKMIVCARLFIDQNETYSPFKGVYPFDISQDIYSQIEEDYETVRQCIKIRGFDALSGEMGVLVQPRTKGPGHGSTSRAFYARKSLVKKILNIP